MGSYTKPEIRQLAEDNGFSNAHRSDSQDICFINDGNYSDFIKSRLNQDFPHGDFTDIDGNPIGRHSGIINYTVGQRKGLGVAFGKPMFVIDINAKKNTVVLGDNAIGSNDIDWDDPNLMVDSYCESCVLRRFCPTCPGFNYRYRGSLAKRDKRWCSLVLAEAITACEFQIERIAMIDDLSEKDAEHAQTAIKAYHILKHFDLETSHSPYVL